MLRPQFRYSHALVGKLLAIEAARAWLEALRPAGAWGGNGDANAAAAERIGQESNECPTEETLRQLHAALNGAPAEYRRGGGLIYNQDRTDLVYIPPEPEDVPDLVADLLEWLEEAWSSAPAVILGGVMEEELLLIQPFDQHNGQLARAAGDAILVRKGYAFGPPVQDWMARHTAEYTRVSNAVHSGVFSEQADLSQWLEYYAGAIASAAGRAKDGALAAGPVGPNEPAQERAAPATSPVILRDRQLRALKHMQENGAIRSGEYQKLAGIVPDTARRDFDDLMAKGLIEVRGVGRATHYVLTQRGAEQADRRRMS